MRKMIHGKHLGKVTQVDMQTGVETPAKTKMMMMPAAEGTCEWCATDHEPELAHNAQSLFYQYRFYNEHGRWPTWIDAMAHCSDEMKAFWTGELTRMGVNVEAGQINPRKGAK